MIRVIKKNNLVYFSEKPRNEFENTELLYILEDLTLDDSLFLKIRSYMCIREGRDFGFYKPEIIDKLPEILYSNSTNKLISKPEIDKILKDIKYFLGIMGISSEKIESEFKFYHIMYLCDIWNFISDIYGNSICKKVEKYINLNNNDRSLVVQFYQTKLKSKKLDLVKTTDPQVLWDFLPMELQNELLIFGDSENVGEESSIPEYRDPDQIGPKFPDLSKEIYQEFKLGEVFLDGAYEIKERLGRIYKRCGIERTPKMKDLDEWFEISGCWENGRRGKRINYRKKP